MLPLSGDRDSRGNPRFYRYEEPMPNPCLKLVREGLLAVGHRPELFKAVKPGPGLVSIKLGFVAHADRPRDARTSTFVAVDEADVDEEALEHLRGTGAPMIAQCAPTHALLWKQSTGKPQFIARVDKRNVLSFFQKHREALAPSSIYRAKLWGRANPTWQLDMFVDGGLLPLVEHTAGEDLRKLLEGVVKDTKSNLGWKQDIAKADGEWLLKAVFWLLAAKILKDKDVRGFSSLALHDVEQVYLTLAKHYNRKDPRPIQIANADRRDALVKAATTFQNAAHLGAITTESLAWVYESALIDKLTRQELGTHSTPTWLVDDILAKLRPWIEEMAVDERRVFEPACGHAGFLIAAMRLLSELLPHERSDERKAYLRQRLRGVEKEQFAYEIARLSLTLADVPNDNGWQLENDDMFTDNLLPSAISKSTIVLANPPFEKFGANRPENAKYFNHADETMRHILDALPIGGIFGVVLPQTFLRSVQAQPLRHLLLDEYEISEITTFADKVFNYGDSETAVLLGRRVGRGDKSQKITYRRVREQQVEAYKKTLEPSSVAIIDQNAFDSTEGSLFVPELDDVWRWLTTQAFKPLSTYMGGGTGFQHRGAGDPSLPRDAVLQSPTRVDGFFEGFAGWSEQQLTHELPESTWFNLDPNVIGAARGGTVCGKQQVLINYAPVSREPWRLKCLQDKKGHPVTTRFLVFRPKTSAIRLRVLWALCNSPVVNAYAFAHSGKLQTLPGTMGKMPVFPLDGGPFDALENAVAAYFKAAKGAPPVERKSKKKATAKGDSQLLFDVIEDEVDALTKRREELKYLHWRIDAEVLRLYGLPAWAERKILDLFTGVRRQGVPFVQDYYFPKGFTELDRLSDLLAITADWTTTNERRCHLIRRDVKKQITKDESEELQQLEFLADARIAMVSILRPRQSDALDQIEQRLKKEGRWIE